jgi:hypothetical protein
MDIGDLVITKTNRHVGCIIDIKKQRWAGIRRTKVEKDGQLRTT